MTYIIGLLGGLINGFFGTGGGLIILPALTKIQKIDEYKARGTTLSIILVATLITTIIYAKQNYIDINLSLKAALGGAIGGILGAKIMKKIPQTALSITFDIFLIYVAIKMIISG